MVLHMQFPSMRVTLSHTQSDVSILLVVTLLSGCRSAYKSRVPIWAPLLNSKSSVTSKNSTALLHLIMKVHYKSPSNHKSSRRTTNFLMVRSSRLISHFSSAQSFFSSQNWTEKKCSLSTAFSSIQSRSAISISDLIFTTTWFYLVVPRCSRTTSSDLRKNFKIWFQLVNVLKYTLQKIVSTLFSSVGRFWQACPLSRTCGSPARSTRRLVLPSPTGSACDTSLLKLYLLCFPV